MSAESNERPLPPSPLEAGLEHLSAGRMSDALHSLHEAYYISPTDPRLHEALGAIYLGMGQPERAAAYVRYAKYLAPTSPGVLYQEALLHLHRGQSKVAEALLRRIVELAPDFAPARQALEAELARRQIAAELPAVQPADRPWIELEVVPQKYTGTDARDRLVAPRAPHHCANCFYRPGQHPRPQSAVEYRWLNLGLIAALFIAWVAYVLWTLASRRHVLKFVPLYCAVCDQHYRRWQGVQAAGLVWTAVFALCTLCTLPLVVTSDSLASTVAFGALLLTVMGGIIVAVHAAGCKRSQLGLRLRPLGEEAVLFRFQNAQYAKAFRRLNADIAFEPGTVGAPAQAEAWSFVPLLDRANTTEPSAQPATGSDGNA